MQHICTLLGSDPQASWQLYQNLLQVYGNHYLSCVQAAKCTPQYLQFLHVKILLLREDDTDFLSKHMPVLIDLKVHCFVVGQEYFPSKYVHLISSVTQMAIYSSLLPCLAHSSLQQAVFHYWHLPNILYLQVHEWETAVFFAEGMLLLSHPNSNFRVMVKHAFQMEEYFIRSDKIHALEAGHLRLQTGKSLPLKGQVSMQFRSICSLLLPDLYIPSVDQCQT